MGRLDFRHYPSEALPLRPEAGLRPRRGDTQKVCPLRQTLSPSGKYRCFFERGLSPLGKNRGFRARARVLIEKTSTKKAAGRKISAHGLPVLVAAPSRCGPVGKLTHPACQISGSEFGTASAQLVLQPRDDGAVHLAYAAFREVER